MARFKHRSDLDMLPDLAAAAYKRPAPWARWILIAIGVGLVAFYLWARNTEIDELTKGDGKVVPAMQNQIVQHLEGGIVREILVKEGDKVRKGQVLLRIENVDGRADYIENRSKYLALLAKTARLEAEIAGKKDITFPARVKREAPKVMAREISLFKSRQVSFNSELEVLRRQVQQREQALREQTSTVITLNQKVASLQREVSRARPLVPQAMSRLEFVRLERQLRDAEGELRTERLKVPRARSAIVEGRRKIDDKVNEQRTDIRKELNETRSKLSILAEKIQELWFKVSRTEVRSPVKGTVKQLRVSTKGGVVKAGEPLVEIVPSQEALIIDARIRPSDRAFLRMAQCAIVKITAYNYAVYGGLKGKVIDISADTIEDSAQRGETFYRIRVRTDRTYLEKDGKKLPILPGMTATVNILTGRKTVLDYILKPLAKSQQKRKDLPGGCSESAA